MLANHKAITFGIVLILLSVISISLRFGFKDLDNVPAGDSVWELHWEFVLADGVPEEVVRLATPIDTPGAQVFEQNISMQGMSIRRSRISKDSSREIVARITREQDVTLEVDFAVQVSPSGIPRYINQRDVLKADRRQMYISDEKNLPTNNEDIERLLARLVGDTAEPDLVFNALFEYCSNKIKTEPKASNEVLKIINTKKGNVLGKVRLLTTLARAAKIPARVVTGIILEEKSDTLPYYWMEININNKWLAYDPNQGFAQEVPANYLPVRKSGDPILQLPKPVQLKQMYLAVSQRDVAFDFFSHNEERIYDILDLNRLSLSTRLTLAFLLLLPLGALVTVFIRQVIGPNVYGTFTPTFFALSLTQVGWMTGGIILCIVTLLGILGRYFTSILGVRRVSRLTLVFVLVAISMVFSVSLMVHYGLAPDGSIVLLPVVILTYMIDRIYKLADADGLNVALIRLAWTFVVSAIVATVLQLDMLGLWLLSYPEAHFITAALVIFISQYEGKKWMQKMGLSWALEPEKAKVTENSKKEEDAMLGI